MYKFVREPTKGPNRDYLKGSFVREVQDGSEFDEDLALSGSSAIIKQKLTDLSESLEKPHLVRTEDGFIPFRQYKGYLSYYDKLLGCVVAGALGDAIGSPVEAKDAEACDVYLDQHLRPFGSYLEGATFDGVLREQGDHDFGQVTDDTQCTLMTLKSLDTEVPGETFMELLSDLSAQNKLIGYGSGTMRSVVAYQNGTHWSVSGQQAPVAGNGAAMRMACVGCVAAFRQMKPWDFSPLVKQLCMGTHLAPEAMDMAFVMALAAYYLSQDVEDDLDVKHLLYSISLSFPFGSDTDRYLRFLKSDVDDIDVLDYCLELQGSESAWPGISPYAVSSVLWSLYSFISHPYSLRDALDMAICPGGDVDTTASMTGALWGAYNGHTLLPQPLLSKLNDQKQPIVHEATKIIRGCFVS